MYFIGSMQQGPKTITPTVLECSFHKYSSKNKQRSEASKLATTCYSAGCFGLIANEVTDGTTTTKNYIVICFRSIIRSIVREAKLGGVEYVFLGC